MAIVRPKAKRIVFLALFYEDSSDALEKTEGLYRMCLSEARHFDIDDYAIYSYKLSCVLLRQGKLEEAFEILEEAMEELGILMPEDAESEAETQLFDLHDDVAAFMDEAFYICGYIHVAHRGASGVPAIKAAGTKVGQELSLLQEAAKTQAKGNERELEIETYLEAIARVPEYLLTDRYDGQLLPIYQELITLLLKEREQDTSTLKVKITLGLALRTAQKIRGRWQEKRDEALLELMQEKRKGKSRKSPKKKKKKIKKAREDDEQGSPEGGRDYKQEPTQTGTRSTEDDHETVECAICLLDLVQEEEDDKALSCTHRFHSDCILGWLGKCRPAGWNMSCPICRADYGIANPSAW